MISKVDHFIAKNFHQLYTWGGEIMNKFMEGISLIAEAGILFLLIGFGLALFKRTRKIGGTILLSVALGFLFTNIILKHAIARSRPFENISSDFYRWWLDAGASFENGYSFPSGHTTATTAFAMAIFLTTNKKYSWPIVLLPIFMACSRIYLMVHYFSDCVGGLIVGTACATTAWFVIKMIYSSKWKFFVWIREFDIFKRRAVQTSSSSSAKQGEQSSPSEDYVYTPQGDEKSSDAPTTETDTDKDD